MTPDAVAVVLATAPEDAAPRIARTLVDERLAACVNVLPRVSSIYRWEGQTEEAMECLLVIKTRRDRWAELEDRIRALHPYAVPEILALAPTAGLQAYLDWISDSVPARGGE